MVQTHQRQGHILDGVSAPIFVRDCKDTKYNQNDKIMKTPITYWGGKQQLAKTILKLIPDHKQYNEPFFGGGAIFFAKKTCRSRVHQRHQWRNDKLLPDAEVGF